MSVQVTSDLVSPTGVGGSFPRPATPRVWANPQEHFSVALSAPWYLMISRLLAEVVEATTLFYRARGFRPALMPITVSSISSPMGLGSDSLPVEIDLFGCRTHLADSLQFQLEFLLRHHYPGVYYIMPSFRGEEADSTHLNQFYHSEAELCGGLDDVVELVDAYVHHLAGAILDCPAAEMVEAVAGTTNHLARAAAPGAIPRIRFPDALRLLGGDPRYIRALHDGTPCVTRAGEQRLIEAHDGMVWLTHMPAPAVPFYQATCEDGVSLTADLLIGPGEIVGCGERHFSGDAVIEALRNHQVDAAPYGWYVEMKRRHPMRTAGFGLGIERFLMWVLRHDDIRDLQIFPRLKGCRGWF